MQNAQLNLPDYSLSADSIPQHVPAVLEKAERDQLKSEIAGNRIVYFRLILRWS